jgi:hypothetical protein
LFAVGVGLATGVAASFIDPSGPFGMSSTQVLPGASNTGVPEASVSKIGAACEALDQLASMYLPPVKTQALPLDTMTVFGM